MDFYLINTEGQGDICIDLIEEDIWDFVLNGSASNHIASVKQKYLAYSDEYFTPTEEDWKDLVKEADEGRQNDVVLGLMILSSHHFSSTKKFADFVKQNPEINIVDEWYGYIY